VPDVAEALAILGTRPDTTGRIWHLPVAPARTTREVVEIAYRAAGRRCRLVAVGRTALTLAGLVRPALREYGHTLYQFTERWVVDDSRFRAAFGVGATPLDEAVAATVSWYVQRSAAAGVPTHVDGAADTGQV
jgi:nucleoside-diphosphate-sugar epimerase